MSLATRPDITFAVSKLAQFLTNPARFHLDAALRVLRYLKGTSGGTLNLGGEVPDLAGFSDSDWGGDRDRDDCKSIGPYVFMMGDGAIMWKTKKQSSVALSSVEAEYMGMCQAAKEAVWITGPLEDFGITLRSPVIIYGDNQGALALTQNPVLAVLVVVRSSADDEPGTPVHRVSPLVCIRECSDLPLHMCFHCLSTFNYPSKPNHKNEMLKKCI